MDIYLIIVVALLALAVSDLIVGVANDAVNFLNSAIGAKVAPFKVIMLVASIGIMLGAMFSDGMMEVARKGVFYPETFSFHDMMILFFAVMVTDILLLDFFNTLGLPTSTTVSIVFELLGAGVAVALVKIADTDAAYSTLGHYINSGNALVIITGILISIVVAFTVGLVVQYFSRLLFTFKYEKKLKYLGPIWGGLSITLILFFILVKGAKGSTIISAEMINFIEQNSLILLGLCFLVISSLLQIFSLFFRFNILKIVVLFGTFGLAMAFAGNDLVNFIGVPIAGLHSYEAYSAAGSPDAHTFSMSFLNEKIKTDSYLLIIAGLVMVFTLWFSRKARTVTETEVSLGRQDSGHEKFSSSLLSRSLVRQTLRLNLFYETVLPDSFITWSRKRFEVVALQRQKDAPAFDLIRATVNLTVSSVLIAFATSLKLPLSTTYVTFMVAMGSSLSDGAWGRESAVYRVTGVLTVIGGWFITALVAFTISLLIAFAVSWGGIFAILGFIVLTILFVYRTHIIHARKKQDADKVKDELFIQSDASSAEVLEKCNTNIQEILNLSSGVLMLTIQGLTEEDRKLLQQTKSQSLKLVEKAKRIKNNLPDTIKLLEENLPRVSYKYIQVVDYLREITRSAKAIQGMCFEHVENNHNPLTKIQADDLISAVSLLTNILIGISQQLVNNDFKNTEELKLKQISLDTAIDAYIQSQVERMSSGNKDAKAALLYLNILFELNNMVKDSVHLLKAQGVLNRLTDSMLHNED